MVTGRVCKSLMARFSSNGTTETLEVKLKLVPVPSCSKNEFLQNMAAYRNPNVVMPEGFDNHAWNSFLQAIPNAGTIDPQSQIGQSQQNARQGVRSMEQLHDMLTPNLGPDDDAFSTHHSIQGSRNASPTPSHMSAGHQLAMGYTQSRPASRMSMSQSNEYQQSEYAVDDQGFEDGPAKKRARLTQADWHGRGSFGANADSLRVAVSTSSSLRNFRPSAAGNSSASNDILPRAPTPRPGEKRPGRLSRPPTLSNLRRESSSYVTPYPPSDPSFSRMDSGIYSVGDDDASSRYGSPSPSIPSSPPEYTPIEPPSSPALPELPYLGDSGFQSDAVVEPSAPRQKVVPMNKQQGRRRKGEVDWFEVQPGPRDALPTQSQQDFDPVARRNAQSAVALPSPTMKNTRKLHRGGRAQSRIVPPPASGENTVKPVVEDEASPGGGNILPSTEGLNEEHAFSYSYFPENGNPAGAQSAPPFEPRSHPHSQPYPPTGQSQIQPAADRQPILAANPTSQNKRAREASHGPISNSIVLPEKNAKKGPRYSRTASWHAGGSSDVDSDSAMGGGSRARNGSGVVRLKTITSQLEQSVLAGQPVKHCRNCGEIKTPTWRPYWTRVHEGDANDLDVADLCGIHMFEVLSKNEEGKTTRYRVYKQFSHLTPADKAQNLYEQYTFCNRKC
jgi:hypothetical protein